MAVHSNPFINSLPVPLTVFLVLVAIAIYVRFLLYFIDDLYKPERRVYGGNKDVWALIILFGSILGVLAYLYFGREE